MVTNNGNQRFGSLQIRMEKVNEFSGEYISISPVRLGRFNQLTMGFPVNEFNWQLSVQGQPGHTNLEGNLSIEASISQILNLSAESISWSPSEGLEIDVSIFLSEGKARPILLAVSSEVAGGTENLQEILLEANPGRRVIDLSLGNPETRDYHTSNSTTMGVVYIFTEHYKKVCYRSLYRFIIY